MAARAATAILLCSALTLLGALGTVGAGDSPCAITSVCSEEILQQIPTDTLANLNYSATVTPSGYSDFVIRGVGPFPRVDPRNPGGPAPLHELYSGEFALAVGYNGMNPTFLERCFRYPEGDTQSPFLNLLAPAFDVDSDADGINEGMSRVGNDDLEVTVHYDMDVVLDGVAMGRGLAGGAAYQKSDPFTFRVSYDFRNISGANLTDLSVYKFDHTHPANNETGTDNNFVYDSVMHADGAFQDFRYDFTSFGTNSGLTDGYDTGSQITDHISIQYNLPPADFGMGTYDGHGAGIPSPSLFCTVVNGSPLGGEMSLFGGEVASAARFDLGDLAPDETRSFEMLFTMHSMAEGIDYTGCLRLNETAPGSQPTIGIEKGACTDQSSLAGTYDIVSGSLAELSFVDECNPGVFDCTALVNLVCLEKGYGFDRKTLMEDAHLLDARFYLVRPESRFSSYGMGRQLDGFPVERFLFTPSTVPDLDVVDICGGLTYDSEGSTAGAPYPDLPQRRFSFDVDAWARAVHQQLLSRAEAAAEPVP
jgi:hypothetical protein